MLLTDGRNDEVDVVGRSNHYRSRLVLRSLREMVTVALNHAPADPEAPGNGVEAFAVAPDSFFDFGTLFWTSVSDGAVEDGYHYATSSPLPFKASAFIRCSSLRAA
jgi:hypothetical protein